MTAGAFWKLPADVAGRRDISPSSKVVYAYLYDRQGGNGTAWPALRRGAVDCGCAVSTIQAAIVELREAGLLQIESAGANHGRRTNRYQVRTEIQCAPEISAHRKSVQVRTEIQHSSAPKIGNDSDPLTRSTNQTHKNTRDRGRKTDELAEQLYDAYPRHVGKGAALKAIRRAAEVVANRNGAADAGAWLLERVKAYAATRDGQDPKFTPHPATWFNQGRYDDDEQEWSRSSGSRDWQSAGAGGGGARAVPADNAGRIHAPLGKYEGVGIVVRS